VVQKGRDVTTIPKVYLETTMFNFLHVPDIPGYREYKADVERVFELIKAGKYEPYTSLYAIGEIEDTKNAEKRVRMEKDVADHRVTILPASDAAIRLAALYIKAGAVPAAYPTDAAHIAMTAVYGLDFIVSLNFEHIVREKTIIITGEINAREGYRATGIYKPAEVLAL
jgi:hypothetical protein